jgi:hypothetical protein
LNILKMSSSPAKRVGKPTCRLHQNINLCPFLKYHLLSKPFIV